MRGTTEKVGAKGAHAFNPFLLLHELNRERFPKAKEH